MLCCIDIGDYQQMNNPARRRLSLTPHRNFFGRQMSQETPSPTRINFSLPQQLSFSDPSIPDSLRPDVAGAPSYNFPPPRCAYPSSSTSCHQYPSSCSAVPITNHHQTSKTYCNQGGYLPRHQLPPPPQSCVFSSTTDPFFKPNTSSFVQVGAFNVSTFVLIAPANTQAVITNKKERSKPFDEN